MNKRLNYIGVLALLLFAACGNEKKTEQQEVKKVSTPVVKTDTVKPIPEEQFVECTSDSLNELAKMIAGIKEEQAKVLGNAFSDPAFKAHSASWNKKWLQFDITRMVKLQAFRNNEIAVNVGKTKTVFYPFSGPDILYGYTFFPDADQYILMGLEPVGTRPLYDEPKEERDSLQKYFAKINTSLYAILQFSFFRTASMSVDLKNEKLDGTLHLLMLFLARTGNTICDVQPVVIDTMGEVKHIASFIKLKTVKSSNKGIEIKFTSVDKKNKTLYYYSTNLADGGLKHNKGLLKYLNNIGEFNTYLKGASYLMHKDYFSVVRNFILKQSRHVVQDDSGIAFHYFEKEGNWEYKFYGSYMHPIPMFSDFYQADLDSLYKVKGSKDIGFGIGYNFKDRNSNFMIATRK